MMKVGFIGLGNMGMPMATNILKQGFELHVYNRTRSKAESLAAKGAMLATSPADLARRVDIVLACLEDIPASEEVFLGENGVLTKAHAGQVLVDHSTVNPATSLRFYLAAKGKRAHFLDAPVSGGPEAAEAGTLAIMVGGDEKIFQEARPVFLATGQTIIHMGGPGAGSATKLVNQVLVSVHTLASCEAMLLGMSLGVNPEKLARVLRRTWGASRMLERNAPYIIRRDFGPSSAPIRNLAKDLGFVVEMVEKMTLSLPATKQAHLINEAATEKGMALCDITAICQLLESRRQSNHENLDLDSRGLGPGCDT